MISSQQSVSVRGVLLSAIVLAVCGGSVPAVAQNAVTSPSSPRAPNAAPPVAGDDLPDRNDSHARLVAMASDKSMLLDSSQSPESMPSIFFTAWHHALLQEAKQLFLTRPRASDSDDVPPPVEEKPKDERLKGVRDVSLGGILYNDQKSWTVWLNGIRITPGAIPGQVLDIRVSREYVDVKWYDNYTTLVFPIRLRPHERFNLDARIFLPGIGGDAPL